jgi:hypothetical protein
MIKSKEKNNQYFKQKRILKVKNASHIKRTIYYQKINKINLLYYHHHKLNIHFLYVLLILIYILKKSYIKKQSQFS